MRSDCGLHISPNPYELMLNIDETFTQTFNISRFRCRRCEFSANILNSIHTHYKIKHPEADQEHPDFEERADDDEAKVFKPIVIK